MVGFQKQNFFASFCRKGSSGEAGDTSPHHHHIPWG
jgi:hypothetical protein